MNKRSEEETIAIRIASIVAILIVCLFVFGSYRQYKAEKEVARFVAKKNFDMDFQLSSSLPTSEDFLNELYHLVLWEADTRSAIDRAFSHKSSDSYTEKFTAPGFFAGTKELVSYKKEQNWQSLREQLDENIRSAVNQLYVMADSSWKPSKTAVMEWYEKNRFSKIIQVMYYAESGRLQEAYDEATKSTIYDSECVAMDIFYGLMPEDFLAACEDDLSSAMEEEEYYSVFLAVLDAEMIAKRYGVSIKDLEKAQKMEKRLDYTRKASTPMVGMKTGVARATRLGAPSHTTEEMYWENHKYHLKGTMEWRNSNGQVTFSAEYCDGVITKVADYSKSSSTTDSSSRKSGGASRNGGASKSGGASRNGGASKNGRASSSSGSSGSAFDPDDHDIEAYYEDNRDIYDDYDEAYEDFLDDPSAWDDY